MMRWLLRQFGFRIVYVCDWGVWDTRYSAVDYMMMRPCHPAMSVAPPWAVRRIVKKEPTCPR